MCHDALYLTSEFVIEAAGWLLQLPQAAAQVPNLCSQHWAAAEFSVMEHGCLAHSLNPKP